MQYIAITANEYQEYPMLVVDAKNKQDAVNKCYKYLLSIDAGKLKKSNIATYTLNEILGSNEVDEIPFA